MLSEASAARPQADSLEHAPPWLGTLCPTLLGSRPHAVSQNGGQLPQVQKAAGKAKAKAKTKAKGKAKAKGKTRERPRQRSGRELPESSTERINVYLSLTSAMAKRDLESRCAFFTML